MFDVVKPLQAAFSAGFHDWRRSKWPRLWLEGAFDLCRIAPIYHAFQSPTRPMTKVVARGEPLSET